MISAPRAIPCRAVFVAQRVSYATNFSDVENQGLACRISLSHNRAMKYGYARVSTDDQNTALQRAALQRAGCTTIFTDEGLSGATVKRPALTRCLKALRPGDTLIVWKLDRLGRNLRDLITLLDALRTQGIKFHSLTEHIDTETAAGRAMWQMIGVLAELERSLITERTRAGVQAAKQRGVQFGPKPKLTPQQITHARAPPRPGRARTRDRRAVQGAPGDALPGPGRLGRPPPGLGDTLLCRVSRALHLQADSGGDRLAKPRTLVCRVAPGQLDAAWGWGSPLDARLQGWHAHRV